MLATLPLTEALLTEVEHLIGKLMSGPQEEPIDKMMREHMSSGGKRIRARLCLAATTALGGDAKAALGWAAACELLHNATLIHDDLQDGDRVRRGQATVWARHGVIQAINVGDLMLMMPLSAIASIPFGDSLRWQLSLLLSEAAQRIVRGQSAEQFLLANANSQNLMSAYTDCIDKKTASLFSLPIHGSALLAGLGQNEAQELAHAVSPLGVLFQIQDDVLDLFGQKGREKLGNDVREGKMSSLVVEHLAESPEDLAWLSNILLKDRALTSDQDVATVIERFRASGALKRSLQRMDDIEDRLLRNPLLTQRLQLHSLVSELIQIIHQPIQHLKDKGYS